MPRPKGGPLPHASVETQSRFILQALEYANQPERAAGGTFGPMGAVQRTSSGWSVVPLRQEHGGIPVIHGVRAVRFNPDDDPVRFTGSTIDVPSGTPVIPKFAAAHAAYVAFLALLEREMVAPHLTFSSARPEVVARIAQPSSPTVLRKGPFVEPIMASLAMEVEGERARLCWDVRLGLPDGGGVYLVSRHACSVVI